MPSYIDENGFYNYVRAGYAAGVTGTNDGHGGHYREHREMMQDIANQIFDDKIKQVVAHLNVEIERIINEKIVSIVNGVYKGLSYDTNVIASVSLDTAGEIFNRKEVKKIISNEIYNQIIKEIKKELY